MVEEDMTKTTLNLSGTPYNVWYTCPRDSKRTCLLDPYADTVGGKEVLMTTISVPLLVDGKVHRRGRCRHRPRCAASGGGRLPA